MSNFTPGSWEVWSDRGYGSLNGVQVRHKQTSLVLAVAIGDVPELHAEANARLIAAAPEMLEALKGLLDRYQIMGCGWGPEALEAKRVIACAEGRSDV